MRLSDEKSEGTYRVIFVDTDELRTRREFSDD